ncbi:MAG: magnesium transporter [Nodularia sp. CChRGM 3473]
MVVNENFHTTDLAAENSKSLNTVSQQSLIEDFKQQPVFDMIAQMSAEERSQLFDSNGTDNISLAEDEIAYFQTNLWHRVHKRTTWLILLLVANTAITGVIRTQEDVLQQMIILTAFIPLLIGSAGNVSTQSATVVIRGLSSGTVELKQAFCKIFEEAIAGIFIGLFLGITVIGIALLLKGSLAVAIVVGLSLMISSVLATVSGTSLPLIFKFLGFDPALMSAPLSSVVVDILGVLVYLSVARLLLNLQL